MAKVLSLLFWFCLKNLCFTGMNASLASAACWWQSFFFPLDVDRYSCPCNAPPPRLLIIVSAMLLLNNKRGSKGDAFSDIPAVVDSNEWCNRRTVALGWITLPSWRGRETMLVWKEGGLKTFCKHGGDCRGCWQCYYAFQFRLGLCHRCSDQHWLVSNEMAVTQGVG